MDDLLDRPTVRLLTRGRGVRDAWISQPLDERWVAAFRLVRSGGRWRVGEARIFPREAGYRRDGVWGAGERLGIDAEAPRGGLTKQLLRRAQPHSWLALIDRGAGRFFGGVLRGAFGIKPPTPRRGPAKTPGRGRPAHGDGFLAQVADDYARAVQSGDRPVKAVAEAHGTTVARVRGWIYAARVRGFLTPSAQGRTEGRVTPRGRFVLETEAERKAGESR